MCLQIGKCSQIYLIGRKTTVHAVFLTCLDSSCCIRNKFRTSPCPPVCSRAEPRLLQTRVRAEHPKNSLPAGCQGWRGVRGGGPGPRSPGPQRHLPAWVVCAPPRKGDTHTQTCGGARLCPGRSGKDKLSG